MIAIVCRKAKTGLAEIACSDHESPQGIALVHENQSPDSCLGILVGRVVKIRGMVDIRKMLLEHVGDGDFMICASNLLDERLGVAESRRARRLARHRKGVDAFRIETTLPEAFLTHKKGEGRVQSTADADDDFVDMDILETSRQPFCLERKNLSGTVDATFALDKEGVRIHMIRKNICFGIVADVENPIVSFDGAFEGAFVPNAIVL